MENLSKTFVGSLALDGVSFEVPAGGGVHALLGGNGSGKSTLIKILAGVYRGDPGGELQIHGRPVSSDATTPALSRELGLRFVHQDPGLFSEMTVAENIALVNGWSSSAGRVQWRQIRARTKDLLERFEVSARPDQPIGTLSPADQTMIAIARALEDVQSDLSVLVLDEPTASLPKHEVEVLLTAVRACAARGQTIIFVSHRIDEVLEISDSLTVLRDGREVVTRTTEGLSESRLVEYIIGRPVESVLLSPPAAGTSEPVIEIEDLSVGPLESVSFTVNRGEILGIAGLLGSGRTELLRTIFGADRRAGGSIRLEGQEVAYGSIGEAMASGIAFVPEHRAEDAAFLDMTVRENLSAATLRDYWNGISLSSRREARDAAADIERFGVRAAGPDALFASLSGGNQQKVVLARWLRRSPRLLLLDEPTQGVDIGARADVYAAIDAAAREGLAVILVSSDFSELAHVSDRVIVLQDGEIAGELRSSALEGDAITEMVYARKGTSR